MNKIRLDAYLAAQHRHYSRTQIKKLIEDGFVLVDGQKRKPSFLLAGGERIDMVRRAPEIPKAEPEEIPLDVLYEDEDLMVINKAAGMVVHPAPGNYTGTLVSAILHHLGSRVLSLRKGFAVGQGLRQKPFLVPPDSLRPGIVHRLDKGTSGVMVIAKNDMAQRRLSQQFKDRKVEKVYQALVFGPFKQKSGTIDLAIGRDPQHRRKFSSRGRHTRSAVTHWEVAQAFAGFTLLRIRLETGRTHQIRVHLSETRHPVVGDTTYGAKSYLSSVKDEALREQLEGLERPMLHAWRLRFRQPSSGQEMSFEAPLPQDFRFVLDLLIR